MAMHETTIPKHGDRLQDGAQRGAIPTAPTPVNASCFGSIEDVSRAAIGAATRVESLVDRLCGTVPQPAETSDDIRGGSCLFEAAEQNAREIRNSAERINAALDRLEKCLP
jgi:hypothetical protein